MMNIEDLIKMYEDKKVKYGSEAYRHISNVLMEAKEQNKKDFQGMDHEQSWKGFKGNALEGLILYIINDEITSMGLKIVKGKKFERTKPENLSTELKHVKKNLSIDFGKFGFHTPDVDLVIYEPTNCRVLGVISCKITLRERIAQTAYWKLKLASDPLTMHIKGYFVTADEDGDLVKGIVNPTRNRILVEHELDGTYTLRDIEESSKVKTFPRLIEDIRRLISESK